MGNSCEKRVNSLNINNCRILNHFKDQCLECTENFVLSSNSLTCFREILNCEESSASSSQVTCNECESGFYL